ncbi:MAG: hypothetical protein V4678_03405 [Patescibacteria group bacterium]
MREKNTAAYDTQAALDEIEANIGQAMAFLTTTNAVVAPQGKDNTTGAAFTNTNGAGQPDTLIIRSAATTTRFNDPNRELIFLGAGACDSKNPLYTHYTVYFVADDWETATTDDNALFKRTIVPQEAACKTAWQKGSCDPVDVVPANAATCKVRDERLVGGMSTFEVKYYANSAAADNAPLADSAANSASDVAVDIGVAKQTAGSNVTYSGSVRTSSLNVQASETDVVTAPARTPIAYSRTNDGPEPYKNTFTWDRVGNATSYTAKYRIGGGAEQTQSIPQPGSGTTVSFSVDASHRKQSIQLTALNIVTGNGELAYGALPAVPSIPSWNECTPLNGWANYDTTYNSLGFTKTSSGAVGLKGLVRSGPLWDFGAGTQASRRICTLPVGFRPANHLIFNGVANDPNGTHGNGSARIDILTNGNVFVSGGSNPAQTNGFVSLDGIIFMTSDGNPNWEHRVWTGGWYYNSYSDNYPDLDVWKDSEKRVWVQGLASGGPAGVAMASLPGGTFPSGTMHYNISGGNVGVAVNLSTGIQSRSPHGSYLSTQLLYYAADAPQPGLPFYNGWYNYNNGFTAAACKQGTDDIVILQGLVAGGNQAAGGMTHVGGCGPTPYMSTGRRALFTAWRNGETQGRVDLPANGQTPGGGYLYPMQTDPGWTALDGVHYIAN